MSSSILQPGKRYKAIIFQMIIMLKMIIRTKDFYQKNEKHSSQTQLLDLHFRKKTKSITLYIQTIYIQPKYNSNKCVSPLISSSHLLRLCLLQKNNDQKIWPFECFNRMFLTQYFKYFRLLSKLFRAFLGFPSFSELRKM